MAKRRRSLSGSPEHHRREAEADVRTSVRAFDRASFDAVEGRCVDAIAYFAHGMEIKGSIRAHLLESGMDFLAASKFGNIKSIREQAEDRIKTYCFAPGKNRLSGMRKRRKK